MTDSLYQLLLGNAFRQLPPVMQQVHGSAVPVRLQGTCMVERGENIVLDWLGDAIDLPRKGRDVPLIIDILPTDQGETWVRHFGGEKLQSFQTIKAGKLVERFDEDVEFHYDVEASIAGLVWKLAAMRVKNVPVPSFLHPKLEAGAIGVADGISLSVVVPLPLVGTLIRYEGVVSPVQAG